uniref:cilia- and flagella-associated protein 100 n=1 Tax=Centroberyx gerrardi TaxID=166262 RepID=UPI003AAA8D07
MRKTRQAPFKVPDDNDIFLLRMKEKEKRKEEMRVYLSLPVHEKTTHAGRMRAQQRELRRELAEGLEEEEEEEREKTKSRPKSLQGRPTLRRAMMTGENVEKESTVDFIAKKREMFLLEYSLMVKRAEIKKLEDATVTEERRLKRAQQMLDDDALLFEEFLKENDKNSVEAIKIAEQETKSKLERMAEIKRLTTEMVTIKSEISKNEEILKEYKMYKDFLFKLSPPEWQEAQKAKILQAKAQRDAQDKDKDKETKSGVKRALPPIRSSRLSSRQSSKSSAHTHKPIPVSKLDSDSSEYEDEPEMYFSDPQQLLDLLTELQEQNLSLIQNSGETEEQLEELRQAMETSKKKMEQDAEQLMLQINLMNQSIAKEKERAAELELKVHFFNSEKFKAGDQDSMLDALAGKVEEVYRRCVDDKRANLSTLQMLATIEKHLSVLLENMESIPAETLEKVGKIKDRERRIRQREDKQRQQKEHQEERVKKSMERSQADVKKTSGRKLMSRSNPVARKIKLNNVNIISDQEEIHAYLFT